MNLRQRIEESALSGLERDLALAICGREGELRRSKPKDGTAAYVWRMVGFQISSDPRMQCMPVTADWGVEIPADFQPGEEFDFRRRGAYCRERLDPVVNAIVDLVPKSEWHGIRRWGRALGVLS